MEIWSNANMVAAMCDGWSEGNEVKKEELRYYVLPIFVADNA